MSPCWRGDSVFALAQREQTAQQIGEALKADLVLTGSLRALPAHYRLRMEMIRIEDGTQIWVEDVLVAKNLIAGLEAELMARLVFRLGGPVAGNAPGKLTSPPGGLSLAAGAGEETEGEPPYREAYELFQRAHHEWQTMQRHRMQDALQHLIRATELDPSLLAARVDLANLSITEAFTDLWLRWLPPAMCAAQRPWSFRQKPWATQIRCRFQI